MVRASTTSAPTAHRHESEKGLMAAKKKTAKRKAARSAKPRAKSSRAARKTGGSAAKGAKTATKTARGAAPDDVESLRSMAKSFAARLLR
jgi:hypothetical protein